MSIKGTKDLLLEWKVGKKLHKNSQGRVVLRVEIREGSVWYDYFKDTAQTLAESLAEKAYAKIAFNGLDIFVALDHGAANTLQQDSTNPRLFNGPVFQMDIGDFDDDDYDTESETQYDVHWSTVKCWEWKL